MESSSLRMSMVPSYVIICCIYPVPMSQYKHLAIVRQQILDCHKLKGLVKMVGWLYGVYSRLQQYSISVISRRPVHLSKLEFFFTSTPHNILSTPLAAFPHNPCRNNGSKNRGKYIDTMK